MAAWAFRGALPRGQSPPDRPMMRCKRRLMTKMRASPEDKRRVTYIYVEVRRRASKHLFYGQHCANLGPRRMCYVMMISHVLYEIDDIRPRCYAPQQQARVNSAGRRAASRSAASSYYDGHFAPALHFAKMPLAANARDALQIGAATPPRPCAKPPAMPTARSRRLNLRCLSALI